MAKKPRFEGEWVELGGLLERTFSGEWGSESGDELIPVLRTANFNSDGTFDYTSPAMRCIPAAKIEKKAMRRGDVVLEKSGGTPNRPVGMVAYFEDDSLALCSNFNQVLRFDQSRADSRYMFYQLRWLKEQMAFVPYTRKTTGLQNLQMKAFMGLQVKCPSIAVQNRESSILQAIVKQIGRRNEALAKLDTLVKSRFAEMFGGDKWPRKTIGELATDIRYGTSKKASESGRYAYLRMNNMTDDGRLDFTDVKAIDMNDSELEKCLVVKGDLLFNRTNSREKVGKTAVFLEESSMVIAGYIIRVRLGEEMESEFLSQFMNLHTTKAMLRSMAKGAVHQANINSKELAGIEVPVPPLASQQEFLSFARQVDKSRFASWRLTRDYNDTLIAIGN